MYSSTLGVRAGCARAHQDGETHMQSLPRCAISRLGVVVLVRDSKRVGRQRNDCLKSSFCVSTNAGGRGAGNHWDASRCEVMSSPKGRRGTSAGDANAAEGQPEPGAPDFIKVVDVQREELNRLLSDRRAEALDAEALDEPMLVDLFERTREQVIRVLETFAGCAHHFSLCKRKRLI